MSVIVDTCVWVEYFRTGKNAEQLEYLIDNNLVAVNHLILAELIPFLRVRNERKIIRLLQAVNNITLRINWDQIMDYQYGCLTNGINGVGIPDLIIAQNVQQNDCSLYSLDSHFVLLTKIVGMRLFDSEFPE